VVQIIPKVYSGTDVPQILPRSTWDNSSDLHALLVWMPQNESFPSDWQPVERIVFHHAATPTADSVSAIQRIQSIYRFHSVTKGWGDIGYNYIIDQDGNIYEGRYGGNGSRAAHVFRDEDRYNFNFGTIGVVLLGTYSDQDMSEQMYDSASRLAGWLAAANNLSPSNSKTSSVWDQTTRNFTGTFTGHVVLGHKEIESTNCPGVINLAKIRQSASAFSQNYLNYAYQIAGINNAYKIEKGVKKEYNSFVELNAASGNKYDKAVLINKEQVNLFSENRFYKFPAGSLVKTGDNPKVYFVENGKVRSIETSASQFNKMGFNFADVKVITQEQMDTYAPGQAVRYAGDGTLVKNASDGKVYYSESGKRRYIGSASLFNFLGFVWGKVKSLAENEVESYLAGEPMRYPDGALVKGDKSSDVFYLNGNNKHPIFSASIFESLGLKWKNIRTLTQAEVDSFPMAGTTKHAEGTLIKSSASASVYVVRNGEKELIPSIEAFNQAGYKASKILALKASDFEALYGSVSENKEINNSENSSNLNSNNPLVRVMIYEIPANQEVVVSASGNYKQCDSNNNCQTKSGQTNVSYSASAFAKFIPSDSSVILEIISYTDQNWNKTANYNKFRGNIEIKYSPKSQKLFVINELSLEDYLKGIGEVSNSDEYGHIQTLIVAARTYAYNYIKQGGKYGSDEVYYLKNTAADQLYKGYNRENLAPNVVKAVGETKGEIIVYNGNPIVAAYSSGADEVRTSGTRSACSVWGGKYCGAGYEYLSGGVKDPDGAPYTRTACGSDNHCVGMSAAGSRQFAKLGKDYKYVLTYYYKGTAINKIY
jgi:peptidoglycan hydrolase-like amidase